MRRIRPPRKARSEVVRLPLFPPHACSVDRIDPNPKSRFTAAAGGQLRNRRGLFLPQRRRVGCVGVLAAPPLQCAHSPFVSERVCVREPQFRQYAPAAAIGGGINVLVTLRPNRCICSVFSSSTANHARNHCHGSCTRKAYSQGASRSRTARSVSAAGAVSSDSGPCASSSSFTCASTASGTGL